MFKLEIHLHGSIFYCYASSPERIPAIPSWQVSNSLPFAENKMDVERWSLKRLQRGRLKQLFGGEGRGKFENAKQKLSNSGYNDEICIMKHTD